MNNYVDRSLTFWETYNNLAYLYCSKKAYLVYFRNALAISNGGILTFTKIKITVNYSEELRDKYLNVLNNIYTEKNLDQPISFYLQDGKLETIVTYEATSNKDVRDFVIHTKNLELIQEFIKILKENVWSPPYKLSKITGFNDRNYPVETDVEFDVKVSNIGLDSFYPFLEDGVESFIDGFMNSKQNLILLLGLPGTGKSSFIRHFLKNPNMVNLITSSHVLDSPFLPKTFRDNNKEVDEDGNKVNHVTIYEDADTFILPREGGNKQLSALLNHIEGIVPSNEKFIITANITNTDKIDQALLRPGRCYKVLFFDKLTPEQTKYARKSIGKEAIDNLKDRLTLTEALNYESIEELAIHKKAHIGF